MTRAYLPPLRVTADLATVCTDEELKAKTAMVKTCQLSP